MTQEGEPYATIKIVKKEAPAHALKMLVTDMQGKFQEKVPGTGDFVMTISSIGRNTIVKDFSCLLYTARQSMVAPIKIEYDEKPVAKGGKVVIRANCPRRQFPI